jgi:AraC-like DNA-binding protein
MPSTTCPVPLRSDAFDSWVESCEISVGGRWPEGCRNGDALLDIVAALPTDLTVQQQALASHLLARLFSGFAATLANGIVSELGRGAPLDDEVSGWLTMTQRLVGLVVRASVLEPGAALRQAPRLTDARVKWTLAEIDRRFANPRFGLRAAARSIGLSDCRLTQLLKVTTGHTFGAHLHRRRVTEAQALLSDSSLSIKEIAGRVGYQSTTQLDRHFKKIISSLPSAYRAAAKRRSESGTP